MSEAGDTVVALLSSCERRLGACDRAALRTALAVGGDLGLPVVAIVATDRDESELALRIAARAGCARALVVDADPEDLDYLSIAGSLAGAVRAAGPRVIVCGDQSEQQRRGAVGPAVAEILGLPHLSGVTQSDAVDGELRCRVSLESQIIWFAVTTPVLLCVRDGGRPTPRRPAPRAVIEQHIATANKADVGAAETIDLAPRARGGEPVPVGPRGGAAITESAADLVRRLRDDHLIR